MVLVILASRVGSFARSNTSCAAKYLTLFGCGLPNDFSKRAATNAGISCG